MRSALFAVVAGVALLGACSADEADFQKSAETFIEGDTVAEEAGTKFTDATCTKPDKVEAGATFTCTATDESGTTWNFDLVVKDESNFEITNGQPEG
ncbi:MAG: DUF4333 domain-containing protein [Actinobacteria bacterium]|nr:DUF4333 domain-containing protein [Actinomycetota bacterium]